MKRKKKEKKSVNGPIDSFSIKIDPKSRVFQPILLTVTSSFSNFSYNSFPGLDPGFNSCLISFPFRSTFFHAETATRSRTVAITPTRCLAPDSIPRLIYTRLGRARRGREEEEAYNMFAHYISEEFSRFAGNERNAGGKGKRALIKLSGE